MSDITIGISPVTNIIYAGRLNKKGTMWQGPKYDVTERCLFSVVEYLKKDRFVYERGDKRYELREIEIVETTDEQQ